MNTNRGKKELVVAIVTALGAQVLPATSMAVIVPNGNYSMTINTTPTTVIMGNTVFLPGTDGAWNSGFTFGGLPGTFSQPMTDNGGSTIGSDGVARGSSIASDSVAGIINITVNGGGFSVNSFNVDTVFGTAGGTFSQYVSSSTVPGGNTSAMAGTINQNTGVMTFTPTGRLGATSAPNAFFDLRWNVNNNPPLSQGGVTGGLGAGATTWSSFTTGSSTNDGGTINGANLVNLGDINGDSLDDFSAILVSASSIGTQWSSFTSSIYEEVWNVTITSTIPVPPAIWLFGSGLLGLSGVARKYKKIT